jgi:hypothetical protein
MVYGTTTLIYERMLGVFLSCMELVSVFAIESRASAPQKTKTSIVSNPENINKPHTIMGK